MPVEKLGIGAQSRRILRRAVHRPLQAITRLLSVAFALQLPDFAGKILGGNPHSRHAKGQ